ncbi:MAG: C40 family peptidase, partial [Oscillospiraceae bacterium]|nr:C40 family peptidase [Oscillospiraceae bacterium]
VSWVLTQSGVKDVGRLGATDLYNICTPVAVPKPGDLVFFEKTYSTVKPVSHVGIYVGEVNGRPMMLHAGSPVQYTYIDTAYYLEHFYAYGRLS